MTMGFLKKLFGGGGQTANAPAEPAATVVRLQSITQGAIAAGVTDGVDELVTAGMTEFLQRQRLGLWTLTVSGYAGDTRELYEVPEVRQWCRAANERVSPLLANFLDAPSLRWYLASLFDVEIYGRDTGKQYFQHRSANKEEIEKFAMVALASIVSLGVRSGLDQQATASAALDTVRRIGVAVGTDLSHIVEKAIRATMIAMQQRGGA